MKVKGTELSEKGIEQALRRFVHRYTKDHVPFWARAGGYSVRFESDAEWLANTEFYANKNGSLDLRYDGCVEYPTWPEGRVLK